MKTINNTAIEIRYANAITAGYGHKKITVELECGCEFRNFSATTSNIPGYDAAEELEGTERYEALYDLIESQIEDQVAEWIDSI